jgi:hypothetical protein
MIYIPQSAVKTHVDANRSISAYLKTTDYNVLSSDYTILRNKRVVFYNQQYQMLLFL